MTRRNSLRKQALTFGSPVKFASRLLTPLFSGWVARAFSAEKRSDNRRIAARSHRQIDPLETRVMLDSNDQISEAVVWTRAQMDTPRTGNSITALGDVNMHGFTAYAGETLAIDLDRPSGSLDSLLRLFDAAGTQLAQNDDGAAPGEVLGGESYLTYTFTTTGTYYLGVSYYGNNSYDPITGNGDNNQVVNPSTTGAYDIIFTSLTPDTDDQISEATLLSRSVIGANTPPGGSISVPTDVDMYAITVAAGDVLGFDLDVTSGSLNSVLRLFDSSGNQLALNGNGAAPGESPSNESYIGYTFAADGLYYIAVSARRNNSFDANTGAGDSLAATTSGDYTLSFLDIDPDDQISEAIVATMGSTFIGAVSSGLDVDTYSVTVTTGQRVYFDIDRPSGTLNSRLRLFNAFGNELANNDNGAAPGEPISVNESYLAYTFATAGTYYISVSHVTNNTYSPLSGQGDNTDIVADVGSYSFEIGLVNLPPVITPLTAPAYTIWNTTTTFSGAAAFSVFDPDAGASVVQATLSISNATVTLSQTIGLSFTVGDGTADATMTFTGTIANINAALDGMSVDTAATVGTATVSLNVNDLGNTGIGIPLSASATRSWSNTFFEFNSGTGTLQLYGLESGEASTLKVDTATNRVVLTVNGTDYSTGLAPAAVNRLWIYLNGGNDTFTVANSAASLNVELIDAGYGNDTVDASALINGVWDYGIKANSGSDTLIGSQGNDRIYLAQSTMGVVYGNGGNDVIFGSNFSDTLEGGAGDDFISGGEGSDRYIFDASVAQGSDSIFESTLEGTGDILDFSATSAGTNLTIDLQSNAAQVVSAGLTLTLVSAASIETVVGGEGNDTITGNAADNTLWGFGGNDTLYGMGGNDILHGGDGNDANHDGSDALYGGMGDDVYVWDASISQGSDQVFELTGQGTDRLNFSNTYQTNNLVIDLRSTAVQALTVNMSLQLNSGSTFENITGGLGNDTLIGNSLNNVLDGSSGNDTYFGMQGNDTYIGSDGNDIYNFDADSQLNTDTFVGIDSDIDTINLFATSSSGTTLNLGLFNTNQVVNGNLSLNISSDTILENILGTELVDNYTGNAANNQFDLRGGDDIAVGLAGNDRFIGGVGNDSLTGGNDNDTYVFDADVAQGTDTLIEAASLAGGVDTLDFSQTTVSANNLNIDLRIVGVQVIRAGAVSLSLGASNNFENIIAGAGNDNVIGNNLANSLAGGGGNDLIYGFAANDALDGGLGNDTYMFDADSNIGSDTVTDAGGIDTLNWLATTTGSWGVNIDLARTTAQPVFYSGFHTLTLATGDSIENVIGTNLNDSLDGNALNNVLTGNGGDDSLQGYGGNDTLVGGAGNDSYWFAAQNILGNDLLNESGGGTADFLSFYYTNSTVNLTIDLRIAGWQTVAAGKLSISLQNATAFERVYGGDGNDLIIGNTVNNYLWGGGGNDIIYGQGGNDYLAGGGGNDTLVGEAGRDVIVGGDGVDAINGGTEADLIIGGLYSADFIVESAEAVVAVWTGAGNYATRVAAVQAGPNALTPGVNVLNDEDADVLRGGTGTTDDQLDLFFSSVLDTLPDFGTGLETNVAVV